MAERRLQLYGNAVVTLFLLVVAVSSYKKDYGFGYMYKHDPNLKEREKAEQLSNDRIREAIGGVGSGSLFSQPFEVPEIQTKFSGATMYFRGTRIYGLDRIRPLQINTDFTNLRVTLTLSMDQLNILGEFQLTPWVVKAEGTYNFTLVDTWLVLEAELMILHEGTSEEAFSVGDVGKAVLIYDEHLLHLNNLGFLGTVLQPVKNSISRFMFSQIKPIVCSEAELSFRRILNRVLSNLPENCSKAVNPVDKALFRARKAMKTSLLDPLYIADDYPKSTKLMKVELTQGKLLGLSSLKRTGPILMGLERHAVHMMLNLGVENLKGQYTWTWILWKNLLTNRGLLNFAVQDISVKVRLEKLFNGDDNVTRVDKIEMKIGPVTLASDGVGAVKYFMETFLNVVPDSFRQRISDAAEYRLLKVIEDEVLQIDLEQLVEDDDEGSNETP